MHKYLLISIIIAEFISITFLLIFFHSLLLSVGSLVIASLSFHFTSCYMDYDIYPHFILS